MNFYRSARSQTPSPQQVLYDTDKRKAAEIEARYAAVLDASKHQDQQERLKAIKIAGGDVLVAKHLMFGQVLCDTNRIAG